MKKRRQTMAILSVTAGVAALIASAACDCAHRYEEKRTQATCSQAGELLFYCLNCGDSYAEPIAALGHDYQKSGEERATCTRDGYVEYSCQNCGESYREQEPSAGHRYQASVTEASCSAEGEIKYECSLCGDGYREIVEKLPHTAVIDPGKAATERETGLTEGKHCSVCGEVLVPQQIIPKIEAEKVPPAQHIHTPMRVDARESTCYREGYLAHYACSCGRIFSDAGATREISTADIRIEKEEHTRGAEEREERADGYDLVTRCADCKIEMQRRSVFVVSGQGGVTELPKGADGAETQVLMDGIAICFPVGSLQTTGEEISLRLEQTDLSDSEINEGSAEHPVVDGYAIENPVYEFSLIGAENEFAGAVTIRIPYESESGKAVVLYLDDEGNVSELQAICEERAVCFETNHFSLYTVKSAEAVIGETCYGKYESAVAALADSPFGYGVLEEEGVYYLHAHDMTYYDGEEATCQKEGRLAYYACGECNKTFSDEKGKAELTEVLLKREDHRFEAYTPNGDATCQKEGTQTAYCSFGCGETDTVVAENSKLPHRYAEPRWSWAGADATALFTCENCGEIAVFSGEAVTVTTQGAGATCVREGTLSYTASVTVGREYTAQKQETFPAAGHSYTVYRGGVAVGIYRQGRYYDEEGNELFPTDGTTLYAIERGIIRISCENCEEGGREYALPVSYTEEIPEGAGYEWTEITRPTCTRAGEATYRFAFAPTGELYEGQVRAEKLPHEEGLPVRENEREATCTKEGSYDEAIYCKNCDLLLSSVSKVIEKTSHTAGEAEISEMAPTCRNEGYREEVIRCTVCRQVIKTDKQTIPVVDHVFEHYTSNHDGTCLKDGTETSSCQFNCGATNTRTEENSKTAHDYQSTVIEPTCTEEGYTKYTCSVCGDSYTGERTAAKEHDYRAAVIEPTCAEEGYTQYTCSVCGDTYAGERTAAKGHDYRAKVIEPTCTEEGYTEYICSACGDSYRDAKTQKVDHTYGADGRCEVCGKKAEKPASQGLRISIQGDHCVVTGLGSCTDADIVVPAFYNGLPVTEIGESAFSGDENKACKKITGVLLPEGIEKIGSSAFYECNALASLTLPKTLKSIDFWVFGGCGKLKTVYYTGSLEDWEKIEIPADPIFESNPLCHGATLVLI